MDAPNPAQRSMLARAAQSPVLLALVTRLALVTLAAGAGLFLPKYDTSTQSYLEATPAEQRGALDTWIFSLLGPLANWDGLHFLRVCEAGYMCDKQHAFFPMLPYMMHRMASMPLYPLQLAGVLGARAACLLAGVLTSCSAFCAAAYVFQQLSHRMLHSAEAARTATLMFVLAPAGIFTVAVYTESLFALFSFAGMLACANALAGAEALRHWIRGVREEEASASAAREEAAAGLRNFQLAPAAFNMWTDLLFGAACFAAAAFTRSNGLLLILFILSTSVLLWRSIHEIMSERNSPKSAFLGTLSSHVGFTAVACAIVCLPYVVFQWFAVYQYCYPAPSYLRVLARVIFGAKLPDTVVISEDGEPTWCPSTFTLIPGMYSHIQHKYWHVGFGNYYLAKHIPQFLLAAPMALLAVAAASHLWKTAVRTVQSTDTADIVRRLVAPLQPRRQRVAAHSNDPASAENTHVDQQLARHEALPYMVYWFFQVVFAVAAMHVNVLTRFVLASPALYWFLTSLIGQSSAKRPFSAALVNLYLVVSFGFQLVGGTLFSTFLPWT